MVALRSIPASVRVRSYKRDRMLMPDVRTLSTKTNVRFPLKPDPTGFPATMTGY